MNRMSLRRLSIGVASAAVVVVLVSASILTLGLGGGPDTEEDRIGEPLDDDTKAHYRQGGLAFIAETGRIIVHESGHKEIVWDPPQLPTLEESIEMYRAAVAARDTGMVPFCTKAFDAYWTANEEIRILNDDIDPMFPMCHAIPDSIGITPNRKYKPKGVQKRSVSDPDYTGYNYHGTSVAEGINGGISITDPELDSGEWLSARFMMVREWGGNEYWLEAGWAEVPEAFHDDDQHIYAQQCDSTKDICYWQNNDAWCDDAHNALVYIASQADNLWDSFCWNHDKNEWRRMWQDFDAGSDKADRLEAYLEAAEGQSGTVSIGSVRFYGLELRDSTTWHDWSTTYSDDTTKVRQGGYVIATVSKYDYFIVDG